MFCIFEKTKASQNTSQSLVSSLEYQESPARSMSSEVSASELSYLKAQVWILQNRLKEEKQNSTNLVSSFKTIANEKYELIHELSNQKQLCQTTFDELLRERENSSVLMNGIECLQEEVDKNRAILEKVVTQNVKLKQSIMEANETIHQMGLMYLKLKEKSV